MQRKEIYRVSINTHPDRQWITFHLYFQNEIGTMPAEAKIPFEYQELVRSSFSQYDKACKEEVAVSRRDMDKLSHLLMDLRDKSRIKSQGEPEIIKDLASRWKNHMEK